jgi:hypothetical protein
VIENLRRTGIPVYVRGWGWPEGRASKEEILSIISRSKINLNISDPPNLWRPRYLARLFLRRSANRFAPSFRLWDNFKSWRGMATPQIKARPFELAARRAFVISGYADDIDRYYREGEEMEFYRNTDELARKIRHYLPLDAEREKIAAAAYDRTLREYTYDKKLRELLN